LRNFWRAAESVGFMSSKLTSRTGGSSTSSTRSLGQVGGAVAHLARFGVARLLYGDFGEVAE